MTQRYDLAIAGGGPAGSAAAWRAAQTGARVVVLDKATFPRDKPCGDGLTPRATSYLQKMGLADEIAKFHRINRATIFSPSEWELSFPRRPGMPDHGHGIRRCELDTMLLKHAESAGAWGREYRRGRMFQKLAGIPALTNAGLQVLDAVNHPGFRARLLFWEGTLSGR